MREREREGGRAGKIDRERQTDRHRGEKGER